MSEDAPDTDTRARMAETVRLVVTRRERAPRSPRMERAFKRLIWRYSRKAGQVDNMSHRNGNVNVQE